MLLCYCSTRRTLYKKKTALHNLPRKPRFLMQQMYVCMTTPKNYSQEFLRGPIPVTCCEASASKYLASIVRQLPPACVLCIFLIPSGTALYIDDHHAACAVHEGEGHDKSVRWIIDYRGRFNAACECCFKGAHRRPSENEVKPDAAYENESRYPGGRHTSESGWILATSQALYASKATRRRTLPLLRLAKLPLPCFIAMKFE